LHLLIERAGTRLIVLLLLTNRRFALLAHVRSERRLRLLIVRDHRLQRVTHLLHLTTRGFHFLVELVLGRLTTGRARENHLAIHGGDILRTLCKQWSRDCRRENT